MTGYDHRTKPETAGELSFYLFDNLNLQRDGEGGNVYRFDTMAEAIAGFRMIQAEHPNWTTALGGSVNGREIDFIHHRAGANVLVDDYKKIDFWAERPDVAQAIQEFEAGPGIEWQTDRDILNAPIFIPYAPENAPDDPVLIDKALLPANPANALTSISEAFVEGAGWVNFEHLQELVKEHARNPDDRPKVSLLNVAYETMGGNGKERGRTGFIDIKPTEMYGMADRFRELRGIRDQEQEDRLAVENGVNPPVSEADFPESDMGRPFFDYATSYGKTEKVTVELANYTENDNLYVGLNFFNRDLGAMDFYGDVTVNITKLQPFMATIDTNNNAEKIMAFLTKNGFGKPAGRSLPSGFCMYPVFGFNPEKLSQADPRGFERYCKVAGINPKQYEIAKDSLDDLKKQARERATEKNAERPEKQRAKTRDAEL